MAFGLFEGPSQGEQNATSNLISSSGFATGTGEKDLTTSSNFMNGLVSGDATKQAQLLAPEISAEKTAAQQTAKTTAENGTRSGGTTAAAAASNDKVHSDITNMLATLTGGAVSSLNSTGQNLLSTGMQGTQAVFGQQQTMQAQRAAQINDIQASIAAVAAGAAGMPGVSPGAAQGLNAFAGGV